MTGTVQGYEALSLNEALGLQAGSTVVYHGGEKTFEPPWLRLVDGNKYSVVRVIPIMGTHENERHSELPDRLYHYDNGINMEINNVVAPQGYLGRPLRDFVTGVILQIRGKNAAGTDITRDFPYYKFSLE